MSVKPPPWEVVRWVYWPLYDFLEKLHRIRAGPSLFLTSWWRPPDHNEAIGGQPESQHLYGLAIDVDGASDEIDQFASDCRAQGLVVIRYRGYVHVQAYPAGTLRRAGLFREDPVRPMYVT